MKHQKPLQPGALVSELTDTVKDQIDDLLTNGVVTTSVVIRGVLFSRNHLLRVEELPVCACADLIHHRGFKVDVDGARHVLPARGLAEEGVEAVVC